MQIGDTREYTSIDESASKLLSLCPQCQVKAVPKGINSTRPGAAGEKHCPNCGWIYGRHTDVFPTKVIAVNVTGAGGASTITVNDGTLQMSAEVLPATATNKAVVWSVVNGTGNATISVGGLLTAGVGTSNGTVTVVATAADVTGTVGSLVVTLSNQS